MRGWKIATDATAPQGHYSLIDGSAGDGPGFQQRSSPAAVPRPVATCPQPIDEGRQEIVALPTKCGENARDSRRHDPWYPRVMGDLKTWLLVDREGFLRRSSRVPRGDEAGTSWIGPKQIGLRRANAPQPHRLTLRGALALILLSVGLNACESARSYERAGDGTTIYLDQLGDAQKAEARQKIVQSLQRGVDLYDLGVGDEIEIFFHIKRKPTPREYVISVADKLRIEFLGDAENSRTVQVRPDGRISMPLLGPVMAAGQIADALAHQLQERYSGILTGPQITVNVIETHSPLDDFIDVLGSSTKGRSIVDKVLPDGTISLPLLPPLKARGRTLKNLQDEIDVAYSAQGLDIFVSVVPRTLRAGTTLVLGEVAKPGRIELERPQTVLMAVAQAGGVLPTGSMDSVRLFYIGDDGMQRVRSINLTDVMEDLRLENDMIVPNNSIIYVPPTGLAKLGRLEDAVLRDILRYNGITIGGAYLLNNPTTSTTVVPNPVR
jgi:protein involved in polysaccharide export with SLBB domain